MYFFIPRNQKLILEYLNQNRGWLCLIPGTGSFQKKCYMQCWVHRLFNGLYFLMNHSSFPLIQKTYNFWYITNKYRQENDDFNEKINDERINRYLNEDLEIEYWKKKLI